MDTAHTPSVALLLPHPLAAVGTIGDVLRSWMDGDAAAGEVVHGAGGRYARGVAGHHSVPPGDRMGGEGGKGAWAGLRRVLFGRQKGD